MPQHATLGALASARADAGGDRPFVTFLDPGTGERTELGHATFANWVAKTANLLAEDLGLAPGDRVAVRVGGHWAGAVTAVAAWQAGLVVDLAAEERAAVAVVREDLQAPEADEILVVGRGLGGRCAMPPSVGEPFTDEVLGQADDFSGPPVTPDAPALAASGETAAVLLAHRDVLAAARTVAERIGLAAGDRLLATMPCDRLDGLVAGPGAALAAGAAVLLLPGAATTATWEHAAAERCTHAVLASAAPPQPPADRIAVATCAIGVGADGLEVSVRTAG